MYVLKINYGLRNEVGLKLKKSSEQKYKKEKCKDLFCECQYLD